MLKIFSILFLGCTLLIGCSSTDSEDQHSKNQNSAKGSAIYGGNFRFMTPEKIEGLFSPAVESFYAMRVSSLIYEGLLSFEDNSTALQNCLAESYEISEDAKQFTITIKKGIYFHDDLCFENGTGREVKASDVKYLFDFICSNSEKNKYAWLFKDKIIGADSFNASNSIAGETTGVEGVKVVDDYTVTIDLVEPEVAFEKYLAHVGLTIFPKEMIDKYGDDVDAHPVGTGPFTLASMKDEEVVLKRNPNYWQKDDFGNQLPFLDTVTVVYSKDKEAELLAFRNEEIDLVTDIPVDHIENILASLKEAQLGKNVKHKIDSKNSLSIEYYGFSHKAGVFQDVSVRKAFNLAINRAAIVETALSGEGFAVKHGFVPSMEGYPEESIQGYSYNVQEAQRLMTKAGYKNGKGFPTVKLYINTSENSSNYQLAKAVVLSLKSNLGVDVEIITTSLKERDKMVASGEAIFWRTGWIADIPDPVDFLNLFYSSNADNEHKTASVNPFGYKNPDFDALLNKAKTEKDVEKRMQMLAKCDQMIIDDAVVMPLVTGDFVTLINARVRKFETNEMREINFSHIFIKELKK